MRSILKRGLLLPKACSVQKVTPSSLVMAVRPQLLGVPRKYQLPPVWAAATTRLTLLLLLAP
ncbi:hypothetical protein D3C72_1049300 [compost metagenome]